MKVEKNFYDSHKDAEGIQGSSKWSSQQIEDARIHCESAWRRDAICADALLTFTSLENSYLYLSLQMGIWGWGTQPCAIEEDN